MAGRVIEYENAFKTSHVLLQHLEDLIDAAGEQVHTKADALNKAEYAFFSYTGLVTDQSTDLWHDVLKCRAAFNKSKNDEMDIEKFYGSVIGYTNLIDAHIQALRPAYLAETIQEHTIPDLSDIVVEYLG